VIEFSQPPTPLGETERTMHITPDSCSHAGPIGGPWRLPQCAKVNSAARPGYVSCSIHEQRHRSGRPHQIVGNARWTALYFDATCLWAAVRRHDLARPGLVEIPDVRRPRQRSWVRHRRNECRPALAAINSALAWRRVFAAFRVDGSSAGLRTSVNGQGYQRSALRDRR
jgi:hypothetical protein